VSTSWQLIAGITLELHTNATFLIAALTDVPYSPLGLATVAPKAPLVNVYRLPLDERDNFVKLERKGAREKSQQTVMIDKVRCPDDGVRPGMVDWGVTRCDRITVRPGNCAVVTDDDDHGW
jgi:hypothetical protein